MAIQEMITYTKERVRDFVGAREESESYVWRDNTNEKSLKEGGAYFGIIHPEEEHSGPFHDFCVVIFPDENDGEKPWLLSLGVGSMGFRNDYNLSIKPGLRRLYESVITENGFCKTDLSDIENPIPAEYQEKIPHLSSKKINIKRVIEII